MAHLAARGQRHFLVVCPASVLINWLREIAKHTELTAHSLHGADRAQAGRALAARRRRRGHHLRHAARLPPDVACADVGAARRRRGALRQEPGRAALAAVADAVSGAQRVLFLTGTPMENRVEEFRNLVGYLRPEVAARVDAARRARRGARRSGARSRRCTCAATRRTCSTELPELDRGRGVGAASAADEARVPGGRPVPATSWPCAGPRSPARRRSAKLDRLVELVEEAARTARRSWSSPTSATCSTRSRARLGGAGLRAASPARCRRPTRQQLVDEFTGRPGPAVLVGQIEAGGVGLNIQAASVVILCEPQLKPTTEDQAIARATGWARCARSRCTAC